MKKRIVVFLVLMLVAGVNGLTHAQVGFSVDTDQPLASYGSFNRLNEDQRTVVEFLYLTQKDKYCTANVGGTGNTEAVICVFDDPTKAGAQHLYISAGYSTRFAVYYNGDVVHVLFRGQGLGSLRPGKYMIQVLSDYSGISLLSTVTFSIGGDAVESADSVYETITLATPVLGTSWQQAYKPTMKSACQVAYVRSDYDAPALAVFLKGDDTVKVIQSHELYGTGQSPLVPDIEEEGDFEGHFGFVSVYLNPEHEQKYRLRYDRSGVLYDVAFEYTAGITGNRRVIGAIIIEC